jgi:chemotaxis signal transduction protein
VSIAIPQRITILVFDVGGRRCALRASRVREAIALPRLSRPPETPRALAGLLDLGGEVVPVVRAEALFAETPPPDVEDALDSHVVVLRGAAGGDVGLLVTRALDVAAVPPDAVKPVDPKHSLNGLLAAEIETADGAAHLLDADKLLLAEEKAALADYLRRACERLDAFGGGRREAPA